MKASTVGALLITYSGGPYYKCTGLQNPFLSMKAPSPIRHLQEVERTEVNRSKVPSPTAGA